VFYNVGQLKKTVENGRCRQPHCRLTYPPQGTPANIRIPYLTYLENWVIVLYQCGWQYRSIFIQIFVVCSEKRIFSASAVRGNPRSLILVWIEGAYATSYQSVAVTWSCLAPFLR